MVADFIPEELASIMGIVAFIGIWVIFTVTQYYILAYVKQNNKSNKRNLVITSVDVAVFPESPSTILTVYQAASAIAYVLTWIATVMLLRPYIEKLGKIKFWTIMA